MKLNELETKPPPLPPIPAHKKHEAGPINSKSFNESMQSSAANSSVNSNLNISSTFEESRSSSKSTPKKVGLRRSTSIKGKMTELSKRVSKIR